MRGLSFTSRLSELIEQMTCLVRNGLLACLGGLLLAPTTAISGDRAGVASALQAIPSNWTQAYFSIDVSGASEGEIIEGRPLHIEYEAASLGFVSYLHVSSHGDITVTRDATSVVGASGTDSFAAEAPLGTQQIIALFTSKPLDPLFSNGATALQAGSDDAHAAALVQRLRQLESSGLLLASRRYRFSVVGASGSTEYTTRGIIRKVEDAQQDELGATATIPSHVEFEFNSDQLTEQGKRDLDVFGDALVTGLSASRLELQGFTDDIGTTDYNMDLSRRRAEAVRQYLIASFGIKGSSIVAIGKGMLKPAAAASSTAIEAERKKDRRVDFIFSK